MRCKQAEVHIVLDWDGVNCIQILGPAEAHPRGHALYTQIQDLVSEFDEAIRVRLNQQKEAYRLEAGNDH